MDLWVNEEKGKPGNPGDKDHPCESVSAALSLIPDGGTHRIGVVGNLQKGISVAKRKWENLLIVGISTQGKRPLVYGFEGPIIPFDRFNKPTPNYNRIGIMDVHGLHIDNFEIWGGCEEAVHINDSYPEIGVNGIELSNLLVKYATGRGIFTGGSNMRNITIRDSVVAETIYYTKTSTHGIYISGGGFPGNTYGPLQNIKVHRVIVYFSGGRHGIQLNGAIDGFEIDDSIFFLNQLGGISIIGACNGKIRGNQIALNQRAGITLYTYPFYFDPNDPKSMEEYKKIMVPLENILMEHNTIFVGPNQWTFDNVGHNNKPDYQSCIAINNSMNNYINWPAKNLVARKNVLFNPCNGKMIEFSGIQEAWATYCYENMIFTQKPFQEPGISLPFGPGFYSIEELEGYKPDLYQDNMNTDPFFEELPWHSGPIDMGTNPDWPNELSFGGNLFSQKAKNEGCGHLGRKSARLVLEKA